jgi:exodeoxyribonuclease VII large subunit
MSDDEVTYSVSEYIEVVNGVLKKAHGAGVWIQGEIEGFNGRGRHTYFTVVERSNGKKASVSVAVWEFSLRKMKPLLAQHRLELRDGIKVRLFGIGDLYMERGSFTFKASNIDPRFTLGDLAGQRDEIVQRLKVKGLYEANRLLPTPLVPLRLAVITSVGSAAHADTMHELEGSGIGFHVSTIDARVQGEGSAESIIAALDSAGRIDECDAVLLVRGGGSRTDLLTFDSELVAEAIARCPKPVFTGIGHEIDVSIADEVAHRSFKTPTACAAGVAAMVNDYVDVTEAAWSAIAGQSLSLLQDAEHDLATTATTVRSHVFAAVARAQSQLDIASDRIRRRPVAVLKMATRVVDAASDRLRLLDPVTTMSRGWSIVRNAEGKSITSVAHVHASDIVTAYFTDGAVRTEVREVIPNDQKKGPR